MASPTRLVAVGWRLFVWMDWGGSAAFVSFDLFWFVLDWFVVGCLVIWMIEARSFDKWDSS
jgi:hypothetical protein